MRLTLRTLLAYMDEILEPSDQEELAKKIESSEFANDLILRTKDTVRRLRLSAPQLVGTGIGLDPNTVAEYLDNVLPPDSVADLERICLESDVHLAEVASCHHVLTMVLGEHAEVDPAARERMYAIRGEARDHKQIRVEAAHVAVPAERVMSAPPMPPEFAARSASPVVIPAGGPTSARPRDIPDYLRASAWNRYWLPLSALAVVLVIGVGFLLVSGLKGWRSGSSSSAFDSSAVALRQSSDRVPEANAREPIPPENGERASAVAGQNVAGQELDQSQPGGSSVATAYAVPNNSSSPLNAPPPLMTPSMGAPTAGSIAPSATPTPPTPNESPAAAPADVAHLGTTDAAVTSAPDRYAATPNNTGHNNTDNIDQGPAGAAGPASSTATPPSVPTPTPPAGNGAKLASSAPVASSSQAASAMTNDVGPAAPTNPPKEIASGKEVPNDAVVELGTYLDGKEILLRSDPQSGAWFRLMPRSSIHAKDRLVALPAFHPRITLSSGIQLKLSGGTEVLLGSASNVSKDDVAAHRAAPEVEVVYGRVVFVNTANVENALQLKVGTATAQVRLVQNATMAVEAMRSYVPGRDPRQSPAPIIVHLYAPDGNIAWMDAAGEQTIHAPSQWQITDAGMSPPVAATNFPEWIDGEPAEQRTEQQYGAPVVEQTLDAKRPVDTQLLELFQSSHKREVKSLVARSSVYVGLFVPFVDALRDSDQRATWKAHIETLRSAMSLGPDAANKVWDTLKEQRGEPAAHDLYEMLCGYSAEQVGKTPEQIAAGPIPRLIDWLENESLDYRVLAVQDLGEITGKHLMPHPEAGPTERAKGVRIWRERLKAGEFTNMAGQ